MKKVLVLTTRVPFIHGGAEELRDHLVRNLNRRGVDAEAVSLPFSWDPAERLLDEMLIARQLRLSNVDRVVALKFPAYLVPHHEKVLWVLHQYRQAYDLWDAGQSNIPASPRGDEIRAIIRNGDDRAFDDARALFTLSPTGQRRIRHYNRREAEVLRQPLNDPELFNGGDPDGFILASGRVGRSKRQALLVRAVAHAPGVRLVIAGPRESDEEADELRALVAELGVGDRVDLDLRFLSRAELAGLVNRASAVAYVPFDEDSMGYVTMEAFQAGKPVITTSDSGGVREIVLHGETGLIAEPDGEALGAAFRRVAGDAARAASMGRAGRDLLASHGLTWDITIDRLLA